MKKNSDIRNILVLTFLFLLSIIPLGFLTDASRDTFAYAPLPNTDYASPDLDLEYEALENMADYILVESDIAEYSSEREIPEGSTAESLLDTILEEYGLNEENFSFFYRNPAGLDAVPAFFFIIFGQTDFYLFRQIVFLSRYFTNHRQCNQIECSDRRGRIAGKSKHRHSV